MYNIKMQKLTNELRDSEHNLSRERFEADAREKAAFARGVTRAVKILESDADSADRRAYEAGLKADAATELYSFREASTFRQAAENVRREIPTCPVPTDTCEMPASSSTTRVKGEVGTAIASAVRAMGAFNAATAKAASR